jgi:hypothetical protein
MARAFACCSAAPSLPLRWVITAILMSGTFCTRAATRAARSNVSHTMVTVWTPFLSNAAASSTLPDVQAPQRAMPTTATWQRAASSISSFGEGAEPQGFTSRFTRAP